ncbi:hypothetical protein TNCV_2756591 [Trichonephila clavipes]|nr:hypothetical protein TNCV_2756591 [Trichonephila clavipes]
MHWISIQRFHTEASSAECAARYAVDFDVVEVLMDSVFSCIRSVDSMGKGLPCIGLIRPDWFLRLFVASSRCRSGLTGLVITSTNFHSGSTCSRSSSAIRQLLMDLQWTLLLVKRYYVFETYSSWTRTRKGSTS